MHDLVEVLRDLDSVSAVRDLTRLDYPDVLDLLRLRVVLDALHQRLSALICIEELLDFC